LVRLIETHSEQLARGLMERLQHCEKCPDVQRIPADEFRQRAFEVYGQLGDWLMTKSEAELERRYMAIGARRAAQGIPLSQVIWAILLTKEHLWEFLKREALVDRPVEVLQELDLLLVIEYFFDRATYYAALGYERAQAARAA